VKKGRLHDDKQEIMITKDSENEPFQTLIIKPSRFLGTPNAYMGGPLQLGTECRPNSRRNKERLFSGLYDFQKAHRSRNFFNIKKTELQAQMACTTNTRKCAANDTNSVVTSTH
jgi:hypothetical protein